MYFTSRMSKHHRKKMNERWKAGELVKITPNCFVEKPAWDRAYPSDKLKGFGIAISQHHRNCLLTGRAAALLYDIPIVNSNLAVTLLKPSPSKSTVSNVTIRRAKQEVFDRSCIFNVNNRSHGEAISVAVTSLIDTIAHIAFHDGVLDAVVAADHCLHRGLVTRDEMEDCARSYKRHKSIHRLHKVLTLMSASAESPRESELRLALLQMGYRNFHAQPTIVLTETQRTIRPDFAFLDLKVIVEYDGSAKYETNDPEYLRSEIERHQEITNAGFTLVRIRNKHFKDGSWIGRLKDALDVMPRKDTGSYWVVDYGESFV